MFSTASRKRTTTSQSLIPPFRIPQFCMSQKTSISPKTSFVSTTKPIPRRLPAQCPQISPLPRRSRLRRLPPNLNSVRLLLFLLRLTLRQRHPHQNRVIHPHNQFRILRFSHSPHCLIPRIQCLHIHPQRRLRIFGHVKAHSHIRLPISINVHQLRHALGQRTHRFPFQFHERLFCLPQMGIHR